MMEAIADIVVGQRFRRDLGDLNSLSASMAELGLLQPIVITAEHKLIAGARRLAAAKRLGWQRIAVTVADVDIKRGECAENNERLGFTLSERVAIAESITADERQAAALRQRKGGSANLAEGGESRSRIAAAVGLGHTTLARAADIVAAARAEPERFGKLCADMDRTGRVNGLHKRLKVFKQADEIQKEPSPLPGRGPYRVIVADPPWPYEICTEDTSHRAVRPYPTLTFKDICELNVRGLAHDDCVLWMWTTNLFMREAFLVLDAWGFEHKTILTWAKDHFGCGDWLRGQTEHALMAVRGKPPVRLTNQTTLLNAKVRAHSQKPVEFYNLVESLCPAQRYAYLFSRYRHNEKGDCHGDEAPPADDGLDSPPELRRAP